MTHLTDQQVLVHRSLYVCVFFYLLKIPFLLFCDVQAARLTMNIRSITMGGALETLAQQSRFIPVMMFRDPHIVSYDTEVEPDVVELDDLPHHDEDDEDDDDLDQFSQKYSVEQ